MEVATFCLCRLAPCAIVFIGSVVIATKCVISMGQGALNGIDTEKFVRGISNGIDEDKIKAIILTVNELDAGCLTRSVIEAFDAESIDRLTELLSRIEITGIPELVTRMTKDGSEAFSEAVNLLAPESTKVVTALKEHLLNDVNEKLDAIAKHLNIAENPNH